MYYQLYRIGFDGSGLTRLTPEDAVHQISMGSQSFVDTYSRVDLPPVTVLRKMDGSLICELETADISELLELGYQIPERITLTAADGKTKLYGIFSSARIRGKMGTARIRHQNAWILPGRSSITFTAVRSSTTFPGTLPGTIA